MTRQTIPDGAWMKFRKSGRTVFAIKKSPIVWRTISPPVGTQVYVIGWSSGQQNLLASKVETQK